jgi:hypothetical protein
MKKHALAFFLLLIASKFCVAQLTVNVGVKYKKSDDTYSSYVFRKVNLMTGVELNRKSQTPKYDKSADYALIWFSQDEVAVIKLKEKIQTETRRILGEPIGEFALEINCKSVGYVKTGYDQSGTEWRICFHSDILRSLCD